MAFPPAYDRAWDNTFPPDTQAANQLGRDLRELRADIQQRMFLSGTAAQKPTPEAGFVGVVYFETDTGKIYRWTGAAWTDITVSVFATISGNQQTLTKDGANHIIVGVGVTPADTDVITYALPANTLVNAGGGLRATIIWSVGPGNGATPAYLRFKVGTWVYEISGTPTAGSALIGISRIEAYKNGAFMISSTSTFTSTGVAGAVATSGAAPDFTLAQNVKVSLARGAGVAMGGSVTNFILEKF